MVKKLRRFEFNLWVGTIPWRREWQPTPVFLPGESMDKRSLAGYSPWGRKESDMTEQLTLSFTLFLTTLLNSPFSYIHQFHFIVVRGHILYYFSFFAFIEIFFFCRLTYGLSWIMFNLPLRRMYILL